MGYSRSIHGVFICIGYVSVMYRLCIGTYTMQKSNKNCIFGKKFGDVRGF